jgi:hypothetical protein
LCGNSRTSPDPDRLGVARDGRDAACALSSFVIASIIVLLLLIGALPVYPYSRSWGYAPSGALTIVLVIVILLLVL